MGSFSNDVWEYDPLTQSWQMGFAPGPAKAPKSFPSLTTYPPWHGVLEFGGTPTWPSGAQGSREAWIYEAGSTGGGLWLMGPRPKRKQAVMERQEHAAAYHAGRSVVVVYGGSVTEYDSFVLGDTWVLTEDGKWRAQMGQSPPKRYDSAMVYDPLREEIVLYGGRDRPGDNDSYVIYGDTWLWDGGWEFTGSYGPAPRYQHGLAYDYIRWTVVMFGGMDNSQYYSDTWVLDGDGWRELTLVEHPGARALPGLVGTHDRVILYGGVVWPSSFYGDTWELK
jgi:hypothetical protein